MLSCILPLNRAEFENVAMFRWSAILKPVQRGGFGLRGTALTEREIGASLTTHCDGPVAPCSGWQFPPTNRRLQTLPNK
jgi:hypothetical protein